MRAKKALYVVSDPYGAVKGLYASQFEALNQPLAAGDSLKVLPVSDEIQPAAGSAIFDWGGYLTDPKYYENLAKEAGRKLMEAARDNGCAFDPKPTSITPTVEVSFNLLAGGSLSTSATWDTKDLCATPVE